MNKYLIFLVINYILVVSNLDKKIMIDYLTNSYKYINIYEKSKSCIFIKSLIFRILFLILFLIYPIIAIIKGLKNKSLNSIIFYLKHPISVFDSNLKSYNLYFQNEEINIAQDENYWKVLFKYYNYPTIDEIDKKSDIVKVLVTENIVQSIQLDKYNIQEFYIENILTGDILENNLPTSILNNIKNNSISIHNKVKNKFKIIELSVMIKNDEFYFISGTSNPCLMNVLDHQYFKKSKQIINFLHNPKK